MGSTTFNDNAFAKLTQNIQKKLAHGAPNGTKSFKKPKGKIDPKLPASTTTAVGDQSKNKEPRGKKRGRDGQEKADVPTANSHGLADDVRALGGDDDDLALIEAVGSESEYEAPKQSPKKAATNRTLVRDLKHFVQQLGLKDNVPSDGSDSNEDDEPSGNKQNAPIQAKLASQQQKGKPGPSQENSRLLFQPQAEWHAHALPRMPHDNEGNMKISPQSVERLHSYAKELLEEESRNYASKNKRASSNQFYSTIVASGTLSDKVSALTLSAQESPLHNMAALEQLVKLARKRSRSQAVDVLGALKDLFAAGSLLPSNRRLNVFIAQPGLAGLDLEYWDSGKNLPQPLQKTHLVVWAFEDWLKSTYFEVIKILEVWCNDEVVFSRAKAIDYVFELLREKPEQEVNLLRLLVNKLGDKEGRIASKASYHLLQLQKPHPKMKDVIISSIESDVLFRPNQSMHAKYYAIITLNQTVLRMDEENTVRKLLDIYFTLFLALMSAPEPERDDKPVYNTKGERQGGGGKPGRLAEKKAAAAEKSTAAHDQLRERIISAILTGVNRAHPFTSSNDNFFEKHMDTLFKVTHSANFNTSVQALMLIQQLATFGSVDRFYRTLYESLLDPRLLTTSKHTLYLNLLFRAVKGDADLKRAKAFAKRMLQAASLHQPPVVCAILYLLRELEKASPSVHALVDQPEDAEDAEDADAARAYDARKRDPQFSNADASCLWELVPFGAHFHPSAALFASRLLDGAEMPPKPDLTMHSLASFLDHFVKQKPKASRKGPREGGSLMQPLTSGDRNTLFVPVGDRIGGEAFSSENFWKRTAEKVDPAEAFFHKYYSMKGQGKERAGKKKMKKPDRKRGSDAESEADEEEIWKALVDSQPDIEGSEEEEDDVDMDDLEAAMGDDDEQSTFEAEMDDGSDDEGLVLDEDLSDALSEDDEIPEPMDTEGSPQEPDAAGELADSRDQEDRRRKRKKIRNLPTFASVEEYADMLTDDNE